eukprot:1191176-Pyramimonas_sp.AAC.1
MYASTSHRIGPQAVPNPHIRRPESPSAHLFGDGLLGPWVLLIFQMCFKEIKGVHVQPEGLLILLRVVRLYGLLHERDGLVPKLGHRTSGADRDGGS